MVFSAKKSKKNKPRVVICSASGLQAGDLAALLIPEFLVERVMTLPGLIQAFQRPVHALIIFQDKFPICQLDSQEMATLTNKWSTRVLVFGAGENRQPEKGSKGIRYFTEVPDCQTIFQALSEGNTMAGEA